jgi:hypothetical protein
VSGRTADALPLAEKTVRSDRAQLRVVLPFVFAARSDDDLFRRGQAELGVDRARLAQALPQLPTPRTS